MPLKFYGSRQALETIIDQSGLQGDWEEISADKARFRFYNGAILNWWLNTKTIQFQGDRGARVKVEGLLLTLL